ncbi:hypothetical protein AAFF_G00123270 [Aldrovandia affinis]|uniref:Uncharacterized protein n=1 Tax=Aldrovandia affinis TaxID=143900 RepID=A0AAD7RUB4_9TELE|nr:hypothetical protein AAFF_G00123270 [Aldrovandia affinis]
MRQRRRREDLKRAGRHVGPRWAYYLRSLPVAPSWKISRSEPGEGRDEWRSASPAGAVRRAENKPQSRRSSHAAARAFISASLRAECVARAGSTGRELSGANLPIS